MHIHSPTRTDAPGHPVRTEPTPEELLAAGDVDAMRRFLLLSGEGDHQDAARQSLFTAAANGLCRSPDKSRVYRLCVFGWPVTFIHPTPVTQSSIIYLSSSRHRSRSPGHNGLLIKMREFWLRAFGNAGVLVSPMVTMTHLDSVLGLTPLALREATHYGISLIHGSKHPSVWCFEPTGATQVHGSSDVPLTYLLSAWVCWKVGDPVPMVQVSPALLREMQQLMRALEARRDGLAVDALLGYPTVYHDAVTQGQAMHVHTMRAIASQKNLHFGVQMEMYETNLQVNLGHADCDVGDFHSVQEWRYTHLWRPLNHLCSIQSDMVLSSTYH
jgi:hypothetical protein